MVLVISRRLVTELAPTVHLMPYNLLVMSAAAPMVFATSLKLVLEKMPNVLKTNSRVTLLCVALLKALVMLKSVALDALRLALLTRSCLLLPSVVLRSEFAIPKKNVLEILACVHPTH